MTSNVINTFYVKFHAFTSWCTIFSFIYWTKFSTQNNCLESLMFNNAFNYMFLIGNLHIHCLEWDHPVDSSSLPADLQCISFVLKSALSKLHIWSVKCTRLYIIITNFSTCNALSINPQTTSKWSSQITCESVSCSHSVCFLYNIFAFGSRAKAK